LAARKDAYVRTGGKKPQGKQRGRRCENIKHSAIGKVDTIITEQLSGPHGKSGEKNSGDKRERKGEFLKKVRRKRKNKGTMICQIRDDLEHEGGGRKEDRILGGIGRKEAKGNGEM